MARSFTREVLIERLGARGDGVAQTSQGPVFVPYTAPGDRVGIRLGKPVDQGFAGELLELHAPGPDRIDPPCPHFHDCGGCALQHLDSAFQARWKQGVVETALSRRSLDAGIVQPIRSVAPGDRRRAEFVARRVGAGVIIGFNRRQSSKIVDLQSCLVLAPPLVALLPGLRALFTRLLGSGATLEAHATLSDTGIDLLLSGLEPDLEAREALGAFAEAADLARISLRHPDGAEVVTMRRSPVVHFAGVPVALPQGAFLQASPVAEGLLREAVLQAVGASTGPIADLFSGLGTFALPLSAAGPVFAADGEAAPVQALQQAAGRAGKPVRAELRDLVRRPLTARELDRFATVVFDPPRAGAREQALEIAQSKVPLVVGVSCAPTTFARDARILVDGGYRLERVVPVDQFVHTPHVELVGVFRR